MAAESTVRDLFRSLEQTLHERLRVIEDVLTMARRPAAAAAATVAVSEGSSEVEELKKKVARLEGALEQLQTKMCTLSLSSTAQPMNSLLSVRPLEGIEVIPKGETSGSGLSIADRLLLNKKALKALEAEEMGETTMEDHPHMEEAAAAEEEGAASEEGETAEEEETEEVVEEEEAAEEEEVVEETEETEEVVEEEETEEVVEEEETEEVVEEEETEEAAEEEEALELEEFEYKGSTYYRDPENNVYMLDEDGELMEEPIGIWSEVKKRIVVKKPAAAS